MSQAVITQVFEQWKTQQAATNEAVTLDEFVFAHVPDLDVDTPIDRNEVMPPAAQIVHRQAVSRTGVVNDNAVVYSVVLGADTGDFTFNWVGLINKASGTLAMIVHAPEQQKLKTKEGQQGNVLTRSFLMEFNGAQVETSIDTPAETWQIDFTARMAGMDERQRLENVDIYGAGAFFDNGYLVGKTGTQYFVTKGTGYVAGLRAVLATNQNITITAKPVKVWLDVSWNGTLTSAWDVQQKIIVAATHADYVLDNIQHYVFALASIDANGNITDLRPKGSLNEQVASDALKKHEQSRNHPDATTSAKGFTQLSSATNSESELLAATPKAVKAANDNANGRVPSDRTVNGHSLEKNVNVTSQDIFEGQSIYIGPNQNLNDYKTAGIYTQAMNVNTSAALNYPENSAGALMVLKNAGVTQVYYVYNSSRIWSRSQYSDGAWTEWAREYNTLNKPSAADVGAVNKAGDKMTGDLTLADGKTLKSDTANLIRYATDSGGYIQIGDNQHIIHIGGTSAGEITLYSGANINLNSNVSTNRYYNVKSSYGAGSFAGQYGQLAPFYNEFDSSSTSEYHPVWKQKDLHNGVMWSGGMLINQERYVIHYISKDGKTTGTFNFNKDGTFTPPSYSNFDAKYQAKGNYTPAGQAYTKAESEARYIQNVQRGAATSPAKANEYGPNEAPTGCVLTRAWHDPSTSYGVFFTYRPLQIYINGGWKTIQG